MKLHQRLLVPVVFWSHWLYRRCVGLVLTSPTVLKIPAEMVPLTKAASIVLKYCEYIGKSPEELEISKSLQTVVDATHDINSLFFVRKILLGHELGVSLEDVVFDWLVFLKDAKPYDREPFKVYLTLDPKTTKNNA